MKISKESYKRIMDNNISPEEFERWVDNEILKKMSAFSIKQKNKPVKKLREQLSELEHKQWSYWTKYMLDNLTSENINRWKKQIKTNYKHLSEKEKDSDRKWADKLIKLLKNNEK